MLNNAFQVAQISLNLTLLQPHYFFGAVTRWCFGWVRLLIQLSPEELATARLSALKKYLGLRAWERFVSDAEQNL
jgi:hypothetical protein